MTTNLKRAGIKTIIVLLLARGIFGAANIAIFTVSSILIVELGGNNPNWTGIPSTVSRIGAAVIAMPIGMLMVRAGRRAGFSLGYFLGIVGLGIAGFSAVTKSLPLLLVGIFIAGMTQGVVDLARYAAGEANPPEMRGRAISFVVLGGTIGSIVGPAIIKGSSEMALANGLNRLSGPLFAGAALYVLAFLFIFIFLRPDPMTIARQLAEAGEGLVDATKPAPPPAAPVRSLGEMLADARIRAAVGAMVFGQVAMVIVMTITPVHMNGHNHDLGAISLVIMAHTLGMFGLSFFTGWLVDRVGRVPIIISGSVVLVVACLMGPFSTGVLWLAVALFLLGYGWNLTYVGGSALLDDLLERHEKVSVQGAFDTIISASSALGGFSSGLIYAQVDFGWTSWGTMVLGAAPILLVVLMWAFMRKQQAADVVLT